MSSIQGQQTNHDNGSSLSNKPTEWDIDTLRLVSKPEIEHFCNQILDIIIQAMEGWEDSVLRQRFSLDKRPIIRISSGGSLACTYLDQNTLDQFIMIDTTLIEKLGSVDEIAFAVAHEFAHGMYRRTYNIPPTKPATTQEELFCDRFALYSLALSGFSPNASERLFECFIREEQPQKEITWFEQSKFFDVHLTHETRWAMVKEDLPGIMSIKSGSQLLLTNSPLKPIPSSIKTACQSTSFFDPIRHLVSKDSYLEMTPSEQLTTLVNHLHLVTNPRRAINYFDCATTVMHHISAQPDPSFTWPIDEVSKIADHMFYHALDTNLSQNESDSWVALFKSFTDINNIYERRSKNIPDSQHTKTLPIGAFKECMARCKNLLEGNEIISSEAEFNSFAAKVERIFTPLSTMGHHSHSYDVDFSLDLEKAYEHINKTSSVPLARLLLLSYYRASAAPEIFERFDLEVIQGLSSLTDYPIAQLGLSKLIGQLSKTKRIDDYQHFRSAPQSYLLEFSELLRPPQVYRHVTWVPGHPYEPLNHRNEDIDINELFEKAISRVVKHLDRYCQENAAEGRKLITDLFINCKINGHDTHVGRNELPVTSSLVSFITSSKFFSQNEMCIALINIGCSEKAISIFKNLSNAPKTLKELSHLINQEQTPLFPQTMHPGWFRSDLTWHIKDTYRDFFTAILNPLLESAEHTATTIEEITQILFRNTEREIHIGFDVIPRLSDLLLLSPIEDAKAFYSQQKTETLAKIINLSAWHSLSHENAQIDLIAQLVEERLINSSNHIEQFQIARIVLGSRLIPPSLRKHVVCIIAKDYREKFGIDDISSQFETALLEQLKKDTDLANVFVIHELKVEVAEQILAQEKLAFKIKGDEAENASTDGRGTAVLKGLETIINFASKSEEHAFETLEFLVNPTSWESSHAFYLTLKKWFAERENQKDTSLGNELREIDFPRWHLVRINEIRVRHQEFVGLDVESKAYILKQLLLSPERLFTDEERAYNFAIEYVLNKLFPKIDGAEEASQDALWSKRFILSYIHSIHSSERGLILAALLSCHQESGGVPERPGVQLKRLFEHLGPAYIKLGQALHSYPHTPRSIRDDLADLKSRASKIPRWTLFQRLNDVIPADKRKDIVYVGEILGSASFNIVARYRTSSKQRGALGILRPYAQDRAKKGFRDLTNVWVNLSQQYSELTAYRDDGIAIVSHAAKSAELETNMQLAHEQQKLAEKQYKDAHYTIDGFKIKLFVPKWHDIGNEYRLMEEAEGDYFETLPESTPSEKKHKKAIAKAMLLAELQTILAGKAFDCDRHSHQSRIHKNRIGLFDHGGLSIIQPTAEDKQMLAFFVGRLLTTFEDETNNSKQILKAFNGINQDSDYIQRLQKALLAMSFLFEHLDGNDVKQVLLACVINGNICSEVEREFQTLPNYSKLKGIQKLPQWLKNISSEKICGIKFV